MAFQAVMRPVAWDDTTFAALLARNFGMTGDLAAGVRWQYLEGPMPPGSVFLLNWESTAIGCAGISSRVVSCRDRELSAAHFANFAVDRAHRTALPAITLQRAVKRHVDHSYDLAIGFSNRHAMPVYRRLGYRVLGDMVRYARVLRHAPYLERYLRVRGPAKLAGVVLDRIKLARRGEPLVWLDDVDGRFDQLWEETRTEFPIVSRRDAAFLRWRFLRKPNERHVVAALAPHDKLLAYAIVRGEPGGMAEIADMFGPVAALDRLLAALVPALYHRGHTAACVRFSGDLRVRAMLVKYGFTPREVERTVIVHVTPRCGLELADATGWFLTELDADT
ncbi:MAG: hypothetical protein JWP01_1954 [Myxococcales bacterium]|nr:hypothetical protein [Myxococcales bacterium]